MSAVIGLRWRPGHIVRRDDELGLFSELNSPIQTRAEIEVQRALLSPIRYQFIHQRIAEAQAAKRVERNSQ